MEETKAAHPEEFHPVSDPTVREKESGKQHGDPLDHDPDTLKPSEDPLPAPDDHRHPHSPVAP